MAGQDRVLTGEAGAHGDDLSVESVRAQLARILGSRTFSNAPSLSRFLRHLVEHALQGNPDPLKEYSVGIEVFDRGSPSILAPTPSFAFRPATCGRNWRSTIAPRVAPTRLSSNCPRGIMPPVSGTPLRCLRNRVGDHLRLAVSRDRIQETLDRIVHPRPPVLPAPRTPLIGREHESWRL